MPTKRESTLNIQQFGSDYHICQNGYEKASWFAFADEVIARRFADWMDRTFDCAGIIQRLYVGANTPEDLAAVALIRRRSKHASLVPDSRPAVYDDLKSGKEVLP